MFSNRLCVVVGSAARRPHDRVSRFCLGMGSSAHSLSSGLFLPVEAGFRGSPTNSPDTNGCLGGGQQVFSLQCPRAKSFWDPRRVRVLLEQFQTAHGPQHAMLPRTEPLRASLDRPGRFQHEPSHPLASLLPGDVVLRSTRLGSWAPRGNVHTHTDYKYTCFSLHSFGGAKFRKPRFYFS